jgi:sulfite reductase (ferredoxin)
MTHNNPKTYPRLATPVAFVEPEDLLEAAAAVVRLHRDHGDRGNRRHARLKYVIAENGEEWARERLSDYLGKTVESCREIPAFGVPVHLGWHEQGDGRPYIGIPVSSGRIADGARSCIRTALRKIVEQFRCDPILMPSQDIILSEIRPQDREEIEGLLREHGVRLADDIAPAERWALACPALPTCGLALTEAQRVRDDIVAAIDGRLRRYGLERERLSIRITGCPNGCARPYTGDIGIVGRMPGFYSLYVGGDFAGTRLNTPVADKVSLNAIAETLDPLFGLSLRPALRAKGLAISVIASAFRQCSKCSPSSTKERRSLFPAAHSADTLTASCFSLEVDNGRYRGNRSRHDGVRRRSAVARERGGSPHPAVGTESGERRARASGRHGRRGR